MMGIDYSRYGDLPTNYFASQRSDILAFLPEQLTTVLDIGCGEGAFGELVKKERGAEVWGVELFASAAEIARTRLDRVYVGNIESDSFDLPTEYFDCVVFNDVLEHLYYPWQVLSKASAFLKSGGMVIASIPNIRYYDQAKKYLFNADWEYQSSGLMDRTHIRFFTRKSMARMFVDCGFKDVKLYGTPPAAFPWKFGLLNKLLGNRLEDMRYLKYVCIARK